MYVFKYLKSCQMQKQMDIEDTRLSEIHQAEKDNCYRISFLGSSQVNKNR